jgi:Na+/H+-dicarboxylate symporter
MFRANRLVSATTKLVFLAVLYGIDLSLSQVLTFLAVSFLLSINSAGIPGGTGLNRSLPAYLAVGIPIEGVLLVETVDAIPDIFKTLVNVTAYAAVLAIVARRVADSPATTGEIAAAPVLE